MGNVQCSQAAQKYEEFDVDGAGPGKDDNSSKNTASASGDSLEVRLKALITPSQGQHFDFVRGFSTFEARVLCKSLISIKDKFQMSPY